MERDRRLIVYEEAPGSRLGPRTKKQCAQTVGWFREEEGND